MPRNERSQKGTIADGAEPLMAVELTEIQPESIIETSLFNFVVQSVPWSGLPSGPKMFGVKLEAFMLAVFVL